MMRPFFTAVGIYVAACLTLAAAILLRGDGPSPRVSSLYPSNGAQYWTGGEAALSFSTAMDEASVERALQVSPGALGQGRWWGNTLLLEPSTDWRPDVAYHLSLVGNVTDTEGRRLKTPVSIWFRVHHVKRLAFCRVRGIRNVCERLGGRLRPLTSSRRPVLQAALSPDGTMLAFTERDGPAGAHIFLKQLGGDGEVLQLTHSVRFSDSDPVWAPGDETSVSYTRRVVLRKGVRISWGPPEEWNVGTDGHYNTRLAG